MRYRPFGSSGKAVSAVSLAMHVTHAYASAEGWRGVIFAAMENGINCFDLADRSAPLAGGMGLALQAVDRRLLFLIWTIRGDSRRALTATEIADSVRDGLKYTDAKFFDALLLDETAFATLTPQAHAYLEQLVAKRFVHRLGIRGDGEALETAVADPAFTVLATSYNITSEWKSRRLLREASAQDMVAIAYDVAPSDLVAPPKAEPKLGATRRIRHNPLAAAGTYAFLHDTPGWSPEELCLSYALTEPALATIQFAVTDPGRIAALAAVTERDPPSGLGAQIEMARFGRDAVRKQA